MASLTNNEITYNKRQVQEFLEVKSDKVDTYTKTTVYTQLEIDNLLSDKNDTIIDKALSISFIDGLADALTSKADQLTTYTKLESDAKITALVNAAPATLDTLKEIATALGNDADLSATLTTAIGTKAAKTDVTASLLLKANQSAHDELVTNLETVSNYATTNLNKKANTTDVTALLALKTNNTLYDALVISVGLKALATDVTAGYDFFIRLYDDKFSLICIIDIIDCCNSQHTKQRK